MCIVRGVFSINDDSGYSCFVCVWLCRPLPVNLKGVADGFTGGGFKHFSVHRPVCQCAKAIAIMPHNSASARECQTYHKAHVNACYCHCTVFPDVVYEHAPALTLIRYY